MGGRGLGIHAAGGDGGESPNRRPARELPDSAGDEAWDDLGDVSHTDGEQRDEEVGDTRAGRLVADGDIDGELDAQDVGVDGAGASAEEAAVHVTESDR
jgi:hypothetical protein